MLTNFIVIIISQYIYVHCIAHMLEIHTVLFVNCTSIKVGKNFLKLVGSAVQ